MRPSQRHSSLVANIVLLATTLILSLLAMEVGFRMVFGIGFHMPMTYDIHGSGFRGNAPSTTPGTPGVERLVLLGDSYAFGFGVPTEETLAYRLAREGETPREVLNFAQMGWNTSHEVEAYSTLAPEYAHDTVVLGFTFNDIEAAPIIVENPRLFLAFTQFTSLHHLAYLSYRWRQDRSVSGGNYEDTLKSWYRGHGGPEWTAMRDSLVRLADECRRTKRRLVLLVFDVVEEGDQEGLRAVVRREMLLLAEQLGIEAVALPPVARGTAWQYRLHRFDSHPNGRAHALAAETLSLHLASRKPMP